MSEDHKVTTVVADEEHLMTSDIQYDIAVIDVGRARGRGCAITSRLRALDARLGILLLSGDEDPAGIRITGLQSGADFCEPKPPITSLLRAYLDTILRRIAPEAWSLDTTARTLRAPHHDAVPVNPREMALLKLLADSSQHAADRCAIAHAFGIEWVGFDERVLEKTVSRLRRKWRDGAMCDLPLRTMHGVGYCFTEKIQIC
ncbi:response regulator transcription factor [Herbaspirillum sp. NPDC087042]|uniref:response regulator transcription factor n=1 Tax=Herbaspirillum sp. NPDC087042 TaxID=3364004 RepID=UPI0037F1BEC3